MFNQRNLTMMLCQMIFGLSFYGVMIILTPFFLDRLEYSEADTLMVIGAFSAVGTFFSIAGGVIGDRYLGAYRSLIIGYGAFTLGYVLLMLSAVDINIPLSLIGIALVSYGRGLMSPNYPTLFQTTFKSQQDFEKIYPINYSVNNVGAFLGQYVFPFLTLYIAYKGNFMLAAGMCGLGVLSLILVRKPLIAGADKIDQAKVPLQNWLKFLGLSAIMIAVVFYMFSDMDMGQYIVYVISAAAIGYFVYLTLKSNRGTALRMGTVLIMILLTIAFFIYYSQMMTSMNIVAINTMRGDLFGIIPIQPEGSMVMNPLWCAVAGPIIALITNRLEKRDIFLSTPTKVSVAFVATTIAFAVLTFSLLNINEDATLSPEVFMVVHFFQAFAEVIVGSLVVAYILSVTPKAISSFSVSLFMVAMAVSGIIGAVFSTSIALEKGTQVTQAIAVENYGSFFMTLTLFALGITVVAFVSSHIIKKMLHAADEWDKNNPQPESESTL
ncbi:peptide MFS transporter [Psychrobacter sp. FDAARGOS_221]|uniref:peptide MFS transporter n=1 Tax=Psychrobacter sp. FDAARGOS_221 TaxID=1975705 RepID=UPI000BB5394C|nr:MFS transporter [Psychrobacter sp. FDAARGOS_221]PNK60971.1 MFS transporter [Psychrobacter sp. FDAARGOS_221]